MNRINLYDKFFHSPNWFHLDQNSFDNFSRILRDDQILSAQELGRAPNDPYISDPDKIYFSFHPHGIYFNEYRGIHARSEKFNGYNMTLDGQYFILDSKLKEDYKLERGKLDCECTALKKVELSKYLVGIGNAGLFIRDALIMHFNFIKYFNGELNEDELIRIITERNLYNRRISDITEGFINSAFTPDTEYQSNVISRNANSLIEVGNYYKILKILNDVGKSVPLCDKYGNIVDPLSCLVAVNEMLEYIISSSYVIERDKIVKAMIDLVYRLREKEKTLIIN